MNKKHQGGSSVQAVEAIAGQLAAQMNLELVEVTFQKEAQGRCLCVYVDKDGGLSMNDCEAYHRALIPLVESVDYDMMEVSSPGIDRPVKTLRDFEKNRDALVELKLFAPMDGAKAYEGALHDMTETDVTLAFEDGTEKTFPRKAVAIIKPIIIFEDEDEL